MCPKGDDPITPASGSQVDRRIVVTTTAGSSSALVGTFKLKFAGWETEFPADATGQDATTCAAWFALLGNIASATCTVGTMDATKKTQVYTITITGYVPQGAQNNIHTFDTNPALTLFTCDMTGVTSANTPGCAVTSSVTMTKEFEYCSRRGICNFVTGECACFNTYSDSACSTYNAVYTSADSDSTKTISSTFGGSFTGSVLDLQAAKAAANDFKMIKALANSVEVFHVKGNGYTWVAAGLLVATAGATVSAGGLVVTAGGATVVAGGLTVTTAGATITNVNNADNFVVDSTHASFTNTAVRIKATKAANANFYFVKLTASGTSTAILDVKGNGDTIAHSATVSTSSVTGSVITAGGVGVAKQLYVGDKFVTELATEASSSTAASVMMKGGLAVAKKVFVGGAADGNKGFTIVDGGADIYQTHATNTAATITASSASFTDTVLRVKATKQSSNNHYLFKAVSTNSGSDLVLFSVRGDGLSTVHTGGFAVTTGGATVTAGGLFVDGGGQTINAVGLVVKLGGCTIQAGGIDVSTSSTSVGPGSLFASGNSFAGNTLVLKSERAENAAFNILEAKTNCPDVACGGGGVVTTFKISGNGDTTLASDTASTSQTTGSLKTAGGLGVVLAAYIGGKLVVKDTTDSTSSITGSIITAGGIGVAKDLYVGGRLVVQQPSAGDSEPHSITGETYIKEHTNTANEGSKLYLDRSRGTYDANKAVVQNGDTLGTIGFRGFDATAYRFGATIEALVQEGNLADGSKMGAKLDFGTAAAAAITTTSRMTIDNAGQVKITATTAATSATDGALYTAGGLSAAGSSYLAGDVKIGANLVGHATGSTKSILATTTAKVTLGGGRLIWAPLVPPLRSKGRYMSTRPQRSARLLAFQTSTPSTSAVAIIPSQRPPTLSTRRTQQISSTSRLRRAASRDKSTSCATATHWRH